MTWAQAIISINIRIQSPHHHLHLHHLLLHPHNSEIHQVYSIVKLSLSLDLSLSLRYRADTIIHRPYRWLIFMCDTSLESSAEALLISTQKNRVNKGHKLLPLSKWILDAIATLDLGYESELVTSKPLLDVIASIRCYVVFQYNLCHHIGAVQ